MLTIVARFVPTLIVCLALSGRVASAGAVVTPIFDPSNFTTRVQNPWFPLVPGNHVLLRIPHRRRPGEN